MSPTTDEERALTGRRPQTSFRTVSVTRARIEIRVTESRDADGIAAAAALTLANYFMLGFGIETDGYYIHSFEVFLAVVTVFPGLGNLGYTLLEYRLGRRNLVDVTIETVTWIPFLYVAWHARPRLCD